MRKPATVVNSDGIEIDAVILDISGSGFRLEVDDQLRTDEFVSLRVDDEMVSAQIRWVLGKEVGGTFVSPVDFSTL